MLILLRQRNVFDSLLSNRLHAGDVVVSACAAPPRDVRQRPPECIADNFTRSTLKYDLSFLLLNDGQLLKQHNSTLHYNQWRRERDRQRRSQEFALEGSSAHPLRSPFSPSFPSLFSSPLLPPNPVRVCVWRSAVSSPSGIRGGARAANAFVRIWALRTR